MFTLDGFLPSRATLMMDVVFLAMFLVIPILGFSIALVKTGFRYQGHKQIQIALTVILTIAVVLFELEVRIFGWRERAEASPFFADIVDPHPWLAFFYQSLLGLSAVPGHVFTVLWIHLIFAITTPFIWGWVIIQALRHFEKPPFPNAHSAAHRRWGWIASIDMALTAVTGWIFYWMAFVATA